MGLPISDLQHKKKALRRLLGDEVGQKEISSALVSCLEKQGEEEATEQATEAT